MKIIIPYTFVAVLAWFFSLGMPLNTLELETQTNKKKVLFDGHFVIVLLIVLVFCAFRRIVAPAIDEWIYRPRVKYFKNISLWEAMHYSDEGAVLLGVVYWIAARIFSTDQGGIIVLSICTIVPLFVGLRKQSYDFSLSVLMIFVLGTIYATFNGIAQYIASAIFICYFELAIDKKYGKYLALVAVCFMFHRASVILIMFIFVVNMEFGKPKSLFLTLLFLFGIIITYRNIPVIFPALGIEGYVETVEKGHHGVQVLSVIVSLCPAAFALWLRRNEKCFDKKTNAVANMLLADSAIAIASLIDVYIARFEIFTLPFVAVFYSRSKMYIKDRKRLIYILIVAAYYIVLLVKLESAYYYFSFSF